MIQNGYHYYHLHFSWRAPVMPGRCAWCDHQARQVWTDGAILAESSPGVPGRPSGLATIAIRTAFIDGCVDRHHLGSIQIYWIHVRLRDELFTNQDPLGARIYSQTLDRRCYETAQECAKGVWCIANFQPSCSNLWLATYILSKLSKRILVLLSHEWLFWWEVCIVHAQSRNWLQKGLCLHRAACMLYSFERLTIFLNNESRQSLDFKLGYSRIHVCTNVYVQCKIKKVLSAWHLQRVRSSDRPRGTLSSEPFLPQQHQSPFELTGKLSISPEACGQYQPQVGRPGVDLGRLWSNCKWHVNSAHWPVAVPRQSPHSFLDEIGTGALKVGLVASRFSNL